MSVRIGIIGTGATVGIAHFHTLAYLKDPRAEITAVYDYNRSGAEAFVSAHGLGAKVCGSLEELLELVDAVDICTPNFAHAQYAIAAAQAAKAVFVEKPMAVSMEQCEEVRSAVEKAGVFNMVGFVYRFSDHTSELRRICGSEMGRIYTFAASYGGRRLADPRIPLEWRMRRETSGSGALGDFGSHLLDLASYACGIRLASVSCSSSTFIPQRPADAQGRSNVDNDDSAVFCGLGGGGEVCSFLTSRVGMDDIDICVAGEGGHLRLNFGRREAIFFPKERGGAYTGDTRTITIDTEEGFRTWFDREMKAFLDGYGGKPADICTVGDAIYTERVMHAADSFSAERRALEII